MRNATLHRVLLDFTMDAAVRLSLATAGGDEIPFEVVETDGAPGRGEARRVPLYCYRPLTGSFIRERLGLLVALPTYAPAAQALEVAEGTESYLRTRGEARISDAPRERADAVLRCLLGRLFAERSEFGFDDARFVDAYDELERSMYKGRSVVEVVAPLLGLALDPETRELVLGEGLSLMRLDELAAPPEDLAAVGPAGDIAEPLLAVLRVTQDRMQSAPVSAARTRFRRVLTALRLFERGGYAIGPMGWTRVDDGAWTPLALGASGRPRLITRIGAAQEDELRAFCSLVTRRLPSPGSAAEASGAGEVAWALSRFEMGCVRVAPFEGLTDYLLALRVLLEPEGPSSGRLAQRLAVICARPEDRADLAERTAHAISLERAVIAGLAPASNPAHPVDALVEELAEHLRAILRDVLCGHLDADVRGIADELLAEAAAVPV